LLNSGGYVGLDGINFPAEVECCLEIYPFHGMVIVSREELVSIGADPETLAQCDSLSFFLEPYPCPEAELVNAES